MSLMQFFFILNYMIKEAGLINSWGDRTASEWCYFLASFFKRYGDFYSDSMSDRDEERFIE